MITIKRGRDVKPIFHTPISKERYVGLLERYPDGFYVNDGKSITLCDISSDYKNFDINIDFFNSAKILGLIIAGFYLVILKKKVKKALSTNFKSNEQVMEELIRNATVKEKPPVVKKRKAKSDKTPASA